MKLKYKNALKLILPLSLGVFLIYYSLSSATPEERAELWKNITSAHPGWIVLSMLLGFLSHLSRAYRWKYLLEPMGYKPRLANSFMAVMAGYLTNFGIPRSGEVLRGLTITSYEGIPFEKAFGTIISERMADFFMLLLIIGLTLILQAEYLLTFFRENNINPLVTFGILLALVAVGTLVLVFIKRSKHPLMQKIREFARGLLEGMRSIFKMKNKGKFLLHTVFIWLMYVLMTYVLIFTVPETSTLSFGVVMVLFVVGGFTISATNGGIGIFPVAFGAALMLFGVSKQGGEALGWITWTTQTLLIIVLGGLSFLFLPIYNRKK